MHAVVGRRSAPGPGSPAAVLTAPLRVSLMQNVATWSGAAWLGAPVRVSEAFSMPVMSVAPRHPRILVVQLSPAAGQSELLVHVRNDSIVQSVSVGPASHV